MAALAMERIAVCVFAKPPLPGRVKTRLAAEVGSEGAARLARAFLRDTLAAVRALPWAEPRLATTERAPFEAELGAPEIWLQGEGDLGRRMERVLRRALRGASAALAIGADSPGMPLALLEGAREALASADAVVGPSDDGGFYLLGLRRCPRGLLDGLPWSAPETFDRTLARLREQGLRTSLLPRWF
ncbi:MAG: TIGR04282 family arsenosugar biosynthesis glycosyltransferase, partial [Deltaproteobacteria bacterium]